MPEETPTLPPIGTSVIYTSLRYDRTSKEKVDTCQRPDGTIAGHRRMAGKKHVGHIIAHDTDKDGNATGTVTVQLLRGGPRRGVKVAKKGAHTCTPTPV